jgi:malate synthase
MDVFDRLMPGPNQLGRMREDVTVTRDDLLKIHDGVRTEAGLRENIRVGVQYIEAWLRGRGAVPLYNLMEDAATAEISRAQIWQWIAQKAKLEDGRVVTAELFQALLAEEMAALKTALPASAFETGRFDQAIDIFSRMSLSATCEEFLTLPAYEVLEG